MSQTKAQLVSGITISGSANEVALDGGPLFEKCNVTAGKTERQYQYIDLVNGEYTSIHDSGNHYFDS